jgi:hypothetical protein
MAPICGAIQHGNREMKDPSPKKVARLLVAWGNWDAHALEELMLLVYRELRRLAHGRLGRERPLRLRPCDLGRRLLIRSDASPIDGLPGSVSPQRQPYSFAKQISPTISDS